jgi:hypothetical protein
MTSHSFPTRRSSDLFDHWADLADHLPDHHHHVRFRFRSSVSGQSQLADCLALCHQSRGEPDLHAHSIRDAQLAAGNGGHPDRLGHNHLVNSGHLAALSVDRRGPTTLFRMGLLGDDLAVIDYMDELGEIKAF